MKTKRWSSLNFRAILSLALPVSLPILSHFFPFSPIVARTIPFQHSLSFALSIVFLLYAFSACKWARRQKNKGNCEHLPEKCVCVYTQTDDGDDDAVPVFIINGSLMMLFRCCCCWWTAIFARPIRRDPFPIHVFWVGDNEARMAGWTMVAKKAFRRYGLIIDDDDDDGVDVDQVHQSGKMDWKGGRKAGKRKTLAIIANILYDWKTELHSEKGENRVQMKERW